MKIMKKILCTVLVVVMCLTSAPIGGFVGLELPEWNWKASAANELAPTGQCGDNVYWNYNSETGELVISGTGHTYDYEDNDEDFYDSPFYKSSIKSVVIEKGILSIGSWMFEDCASLVDVTIPISVMSIGESAFYDCKSLQSITIPDSVKSIGIDVFYNTAYYNDFENWENDVLYIDKHLIESKASISDEYNVKDGTLTIADYAFFNRKNLRKITIPDSVTNIGRSVFVGTAYYYNDANWENDVLYISKHLVASYYGISGSYNIKPGTLTIAGDVFGECYELTNVVIPNSVISIGESAFNDCYFLESITIADSVTFIGDRAFYQCGHLESIVIPENVTFIGDYVFSLCDNLVNISVDKNNKYYSSDNYGALFNKDKSKIIQYPIGNRRESYTIPDSVTSIEYKAFWDCKSLASIEIPDSVTSIGDNAFWYCKSLTSIEIPDSVTSIGHNAFGSCTSLVNVEIPGSVTFIGDEAFAFCTGLISITIGGGVTTIGSNAFYGSKNLINVTIPDSVIVIGSGAFAYCESLTTVFMGNGVTDIYAGAFKGANLKDVYFNGTEERWSTIIIDFLNDPLLNATIHFLGEEPTGNIYNLGEETYSFKNFGDLDSLGGHCFGMSSTSSGYYLGELDVTKVGISDSKDLFTLSKTSLVKQPICYYQPRQGIYAINATVAGGENYKQIYYFRTEKYDIESDWEEIIDYVKNHEYDNLGKFQIGFQKKGMGGHAVNFLYYSVVDGQERIYVYDNNFPNTETYFYMNDNGEVYQAPYQTFTGSIDCIALRDVSKYFETVNEYEPSKFIYANDDEIEVSGASLYPMDCNVGNCYVMFECDESQTKVVIEPLVDNATFMYMGQEYSFGKIDEDTYAEFTLSTSDDETPEMVIINAPEENPSENCSCNCHKGGIKGFFFKFLLFFQKIFRTNKTCKCGINHYL